MASKQIHPPRVPFTKEVKNAQGETEHVITREWYYYLRELKLTDDEIITMVSVIETSAQNAIAAAAQANSVAKDAVFRASLPQSRASVSEVSKRAADALLLAYRPNSDAAIAKLMQRIADLELRSVRAGNDAAIAKLRQRVADLEVKNAFPIPSGSADTTLDCATLEAIGYWQPVTDGAMGLIDNGDGEVVVAFTCTS